jgi:predicted permease
MGSDSVVSAGPDRSCVSLVSIFASAILPVFALAFVGFLLGQWQGVDVGPLNTVAVYVLAPALAFDSLATSPLAGETLARIAVGVAVFTLLMAAVAEVAGRALDVEEPLLSALVLVSISPNSGNYGIPLSEFAFGATGRSTAVVFMTAQGVLIYTVGVYIAARSGAGSWTEGVRRVFAVPLIYAVAAALAARALDLVPPVDGTAMTTVGLVGDSAIPVMLLILGIEVAGSDYTVALREVGAATLLKMGVAPLVGVAVALAVGFGDDTVTSVFVLEAAAPAAVTPLILLIEFGDDSPVAGTTVSEYASTVVLATMLVSVPVMTLLISLLQGGLL